MSKSHIFLLGTKSIAALLLLQLTFLCESVAQKNSPSAPPKEMQKLLERQVGWDDAMPDKMNPGGLKLHFEEIDEKEFRGHKYPRFRVYASGAPEDKVYMLGSWPLGMDLSVPPTEIYLNERGLLMARKPRPDEETLLKVSDDAEIDVMPLTITGEPSRMILASMDRTLMIPGTLVPFPVVANDANCRLEIRLATPRATALLIIADGFSPKTKIPMKAVSEGEAIDGFLETNANGHAVTVDFPAVDGKTSGILHVAAQGDGCAPSVSIPWGS